MVFRIVSLNLFNGLVREHKVEPSDAGRLVVPVAMASKLCTHEELHRAPVLKPVVNYGEFDTNALEAVGATLRDEENVGEELVAIWTCATEDGRLLDLLDDEVELVRS